MSFNPVSLVWRGGLCLWALFPLTLRAEVFLSAEEALRLAFPQGVFARETLYLTAHQREAASRMAKGPVPGIVTRFRVTLNDKVLAFAYLDTHRVRTLPETVLVILNAEGAVQRVEILRFDEPRDYLPRSSWYRQFNGTTQERPPELGNTIRPVTGATLTAHATTEAVRRVLALHRVLEQ